MLIWKISTGIIKDNLFWGTGLNTFKCVYPIYQSEYYLKGHMTEKEIMLADNTYYAFNEYIQFFCENGFVGFSLLLVFLFVIRKKIHTNELAAPFFSILFASLFSYTLHTSYLQMLFVLIISLFSSKFPNKYSLYYFKAKYLYLICFIISLLLFVSNFNKLHAYRKFIALKGQPAVTIMNECAKLENQLGNNSTFLFDFAKNLFYQKQYEEAKLKANHLSSIILNTEICLLQGRIYEKLDNFIEAEKSFQRAIAICPNRFTSRYELMKLYIEYSKKNKARKVALEIINLNEKFPSPQSLAIKEAAEKYLKDTDYDN